MSDFADVKIIDVAAPGKWSLNGGPFGSKLVSSMYVDEGVPVIRGANLPLDRRFLDENFVYVSEAKAEELRAHTAAPGDVVITQRGTLGQVGLIPPGARHQRYVISQSQMKLTVNPSVADPGYIYYSFRTPQIIGRFVALASTSGVPHVNLQTLRDFRIPLPPVHTQRRIASILEAYDDLIEINRRRVAVLEEMAGGLFEMMVTNLAGELPPPSGGSGNCRPPGGWKISELGDVADFIMGQSPPSEELNREGRGFPFHQGVTDFGALFPGHRVYCTPSNSKKLAAAGDILFSVRAPVGRINIATEEVVLGRGVSSIRSKIGTQRFFAAHLRATFHKPDLIGNGAIYKAVGRQDIRKVPVILPPTEVRDQVDGRIGPFYDLLWTIEQSNAALASARDLLLPRLISGQLSLREAERELADAA